VKLMWSSLPVIGTWVAMIGGGAFVSFLELATIFLLRLEHRPPLAAGLSFWPQVLGALVTAGLLGTLFRTRYLPQLVLGGMPSVIGGGVLLLTLEPGSGSAQLLAAVGLLGLGAGATVSPGLFLAGFSLSSQMIGRIFALVELVRTVPDFILAPVMLEIASAASASSGAQLSLEGLRTALAATLALTLAATLFGVFLYAASGLRLPRPDLKRWIEGGGRALDSPQLLAALRPSAKPAE
jgi:hypothetical protein